MKSTFTLAQMFQEKLLTFFQKDKRGNAILYRTFSTALHEAFGQAQRSLTKKKLTALVDEGKAKALPFLTEYWNPLRLYYLKASLGVSKGVMKLQNLSENDMWAVVRKIKIMPSPIEKDAATKKKENEAKVIVCGTLAQYIKTHKTSMPLGFSLYARRMCVLNQNFWDPRSVKPKAKDEAQRFETYLFAMLSLTQKHAKDISWQVLTLSSKPETLIQAALLIEQTPTDKAVAFIQKALKASVAASAPFAKPYYSNRKFAANLKRD